jgi:cholesterol oxidase
MRAGAAGLAVSPQLGTRVSSNGDMLGFCYAGDDKTNLIAEPATTSTSRIGTALMSYVDYRGDHAKGPNLQDRFLLLEGSIPTAVANTVAKALAVASNDFYDQLSEEQRKLIQLDMRYLDRAHPDGALQHSTLYLACGHDDAGGRYVYRADDRPRISWPTLTTSRFVQAIEDEMRAFTEARGGYFMRNPRQVLSKRLIAPHILGGCPMAERGDLGVADHAGRVFDGATATTHRGLHVLDASMLPRSLGATPLLTICALTERAVEQMT